jgi:hypothetical protein
MLRRLSLVGESLPAGTAVRVGDLEALVALDARHGVFPNLVVTPLLSAIWAMNKMRVDTTAFWNQVEGLLESTQHRFNAFSKSASTDPKNPEFVIHPIASKRLAEFDTSSELWALFGYQTIFGLMRYVLTGEKKATKREIKKFAKSFLTVAIQHWVDGAGIPKGVPGNMCAQEGMVHRLCTHADTDGTKVVTMLRHAIAENTLFSGMVEHHLKVFRCFVPLLHNEAYQLAPYGVGQANFALAEDYYVMGTTHSVELYWKVMGETLRRRLMTEEVVGTVSKQGDEVLK